MPCIGPRGGLRGRHPFVPVPWFDGLLMNVAFQLLNRELHSGDRNRTTWVRSIVITFGLCVVIDPRPARVISSSPLANSVTGRELVSRKLGRQRVGRYGNSLNSVTGVPHTWAEWSVRWFCVGPGVKRD